MTQEEFKDILTPEFKGFTSRMWVDYLDETNGPFAQTDDYASFCTNRYAVINNLKYLIRKFNEKKT
jgi:hypothetical protein